MKVKTNFKNAIRNLGRREQHNIAKIVCLGMGLAVGSVLITKVCFEQTYDTFFPQHDRVYQINEDITRIGEYKNFPYTSGAIAPGIKRYCPQVEAATRYSEWGTDITFETEDKKKISTNYAMADSCFFDVVHCPILEGIPREVLSRPYYCMINHKLAEELGGNVIGKTLTMTDADSIKFIIGGVYEDIPLNSSMSNLRILVSLSSLKTLWNGWQDGTENWDGNDRYRSLIRLVNGAKISDIIPQVKKMCKENLPIERMKKEMVDLQYSFIPLTYAHTSDPNVKKMSWILSLLAFILVFSAAMNYLLIVIGNMTWRAKEMAVRKCYGAESGNIHSIIFIEALIHLFLAIILATILLYISKGTIEEILSAPVSTLLFSKSSWILAVICLVILLIGGIIPGYLFSSIPVSTVFRKYTETRRQWKLILLSIQFIASGLLISLLFIINKQYNLMINNDPGYCYDKLAVAKLGPTDPEKGDKALNELRKCADVESITSATSMLTNEEQDGNNISEPGDNKTLLNVADLYTVSNGYFTTMGIKILKGRNFTEQTDSLKEVMVSSSFVDKMRTTAGWNGDIIGRKIEITAHGTYTICGVYNNILLGSLSSPDSRASILFYSKHANPFLLIKFHSLTRETMDEIRSKLKSLYPKKDIEVTSYQTLINNLYQPQYNFRKAILAGGLITLLIALTGLIGYTNDEMNRRSKEIAIRKVNGAEVKNILNLFARDILNIAIPSLIIGNIGSLFLARKWLEQFSEKTPLGFFLFLGCGLLILFIILTTVNINCHKIANSNPVDYLKGE